VKNNLTHVACIQEVLSLYAGKDAAILSISFVFLHSFQAIAKVLPVSSLFVIHKHYATLHSVLHNLAFGGLFPRG
jgi:hypothetical protein